MLFCEPCRVKKNWPHLPGYPDIGWKPSAICEICRSYGGCHDVPASRLKFAKDRTIEEKLIADTMEQGYRVKAEGLAIWNLNGTLDSQMTEQLRKTFIGSEEQPDWYCTFLLRLKLQRNHRLSEEQKRDKKLRQ